MSRFLKKSLYALTGTFAVALTLVLVFGYVNDSRVNLPDEKDIKPPKAFIQKVGSVLTSDYDHVWQQDGGKDWHSAVEETIKSHKQLLIADSGRFSSPYQVYAALGSYPTRIAARDSLFIPGGSELLIIPKVTNNLILRFEAASFFDEAEVQVKVDEMSFGRLKLKPVNEPQDRHDPFFKAVGRFWNVDSLPPGGEWSLYSKEINLGPESVLRLRCISAKGHCVVTDPALFRVGKSGRDNFVMIMIDTMRADALNERSAPFLTSLAKKSTWFRNAIAAGNMTSPSTNGMLACRKPTELRDVAFAYSVSPEKREQYYVEGKQSFPAVFAKNNYTTAMLGNISVISEVIGAGVQHGFSEQVSMETEGYETPHLAREAITWLKNHNDTPFFLYLHFNAPHAAYRPPLRDIFATYPGLKGFGSRAAFMKWMYDAEVHFTDRYVEKVVKAIEKIGIKEQTKIVVAADHGDQFTSHAFKYNRVGRQVEGSFFDHGATLLNDEIAVPFFVYDPHEKGQEITGPVQTLDIGPTLLDVANLPVPNWCDGRSLASVLDGDPLPERTIGSEGFRGRAVVFQNRYKYIRSHAPTRKRLYGESGYFGTFVEVFIPEELYDLQNDPDEKNNLVMRDMDLLQKARRVYDEYYDVKTAYELVLESPKKTPYRVWFGGKPSLTLSDDAKSFEFSDGTRIVGELKGRTKILISNWKSGKITVNFGEEKKELLLTSLGLPIQFEDAHRIPREGREPLQTRQVDAERAILRRIIINDAESREIVKGNPQFEEILREWGYLNDNT